MDLFIHLLQLDRIVKEKVGVYSPFLSGSQYFCNEISDQIMSTTTTVTPTKLWSGGKSPFNVEYGKLMMWYFLMSDAFTFGAFLISYGTIRFSTNGWPNPNEVFKSFPFAPEG